MHPLLEQPWRVVLTGFCLLAASGAQAQVMATGPSVSDGISVFGTGELMAQPNLVEIDLFVSGKAELTADALVKHRDARKRLLESFDKLKLSSLSSSERGLTVTAGTPLEQQQRLINGMPQTPTKTQIEVASTIRVQLKDIRGTPAEELIRLIGKLLDTAQDAGVTIGPSPAEVMRNARFGNYLLNNSAVRFIVSDLEELREKAYERAVAEARLRAVRLAQLNHVRLGSALSVQEIQVAGDAPSSNSTVNAYVYYGQSQTPAGPEEIGSPKIVSSTISGTPVQVKLLVRFAIQPDEPATVQK
jgi:uncharacterized protein YggE